MGWSKQAKTLAANYGVRGMKKGIRKPKPLAKGKSKSAIHPKIAQIAKEHLGVDTLERRGMDSQDFHDQATWTLTKAMHAAYAHGAKDPNAKLSDDEIEEMGVETFNRAARESVLAYTKEWEEYVTRQARWVDFENDYKTLDITFMESVIWAFKKLYDKGLTLSQQPEGVYQQLVGYRTGDMWAPRLETTEALRVEADEFVRSIETGAPPTEADMPAFILERLGRTLQSFEKLHGAS